MYPGARTAIVYPSAGSTPMKTKRPFESVATRVEAVRHDTADGGTQLLLGSLLGRDHTDSQVSRQN
jgi:hypothetical protein